MSCILKWIQEYFFNRDIGKVLTELMYLCMVLVSIGFSSFFSSTMPIVQSTNFELCDKMKKNARMQNIFYATNINLKKTWPFPTMSVLNDSNSDPKNQMHKRDKSLLSAIHVCKVFFFLSFMECGTPFTKHLKNYALWIFFPICVTFGIKSTHFVKKTHTFFQIEL